MAKPNFLVHFDFFGPVKEKCEGKKNKEWGSWRVGVQIIKSVVSNWKIGFQKGKGSKEEIWVGWDNLLDWEGFHTKLPMYRLILPRQLKK